MPSIATEFKYGNNDVMLEVIILSAALMIACCKNLEYEDLGLPRFKQFCDIAAHIFSESHGEILGTYNDWCTRLRHITDTQSITTEISVVGGFDLRVIISHVKIYNLQHM